MVNNMNIVVNPSFGSCDCCNKKEEELKVYVTKDISTIPEGTKLVKVFIDNSPDDDDMNIGAYWLCQSCFNLYWTDKETFKTKCNENS